MAAQKPHLTSKTAAAVVSKYRAESLSVMQMLPPSWGMCHRLGPPASGCCFLASWSLGLELSRVGLCVYIWSQISLVCEEEEEP